MLRLPDMPGAARSNPELVWAARPAEAEQVSIVSVQELVRWHLAHHQGMQAQDVCKMLYQAVFGPSHVLAQPEEAFQALQAEFASLQAAEGEPLVEPIAPNGTVFRLNLRPYKQRGGELLPLWEALLESARGVSGSAEEFLTLWSLFAQCVREGCLPFSVAEVEAIDASLAAQGVRALHHSDDYRHANAPSYRVLTEGALQRLLSSQKVSRGIAQE